MMFGGWSTGGGVIATSTTTVTVSAQDARKIYTYIQNVGTVPLFLGFGLSASSGVYHAILAGGSASENGTGVACTIDKYIGAITVYSTGVGKLCYFDNMEST
jgi:hypothetical protein